MGVCDGESPRAGSTMACLPHTQQRRVVSTEWWLSPGPCSRNFTWNDPSRSTTAPWAFAPVGGSPADKPGWFYRIGSQGSGAANLKSSGQELTPALRQIPSSRSENLHFRSEGLHLVG